MTFSLTGGWSPVFGASLARKHKLARCAQPAPGGRQDFMDAVTAATMPLGSLVAPRV
jgi:hypothetical protein